MEKNIQSLVNASESISSSFSKLRFVTIACLACTFLCALGCVGYSVYSIKSVSDKVYVIDKGQVSLATRTDAAVSREDEIKSLAGNFHKLFFNVSPVENVVRGNLEEALALSADKSVYNYYNDLRESGFYERIKQANAVQEIVVDTVAVDMSRYPYPVQVASTLFIMRQSLLTRSSLITSMTMVEVPRDPANLNGLKIENFKVLRNEELDRKVR